MLKSIYISKLFERFDYKIEIKDEGILIITGPNGFGKSTILKMVDIFCNGSLGDLLCISFSKFILETDKNKIVIKKNKKTFKVDEISMPYPTDFANESITNSQINFGSYNDFKKAFRNKAYHSPMNLRLFSNSSIKDEFYYNLYDSNVYSSGTIKGEYKFEKQLDEMFNKIELIKQQIGKVQFIREQRLIEERKLDDDDFDSYDFQKIEYVKVINENSENLKYQLSKIMKDHSSLSNMLDSTYIKRLFDLNLNQSYNQGNVLKQLTLIHDKQEKLKKYKLAETTEVNFIDNLDKSKINRFAAELSIFIEDTNAKYKVFEDIIDKLDLYEKIVNNKLAFKTMELSSTDGIIVKSEEGTILKLSELSSGEQEILVLFYKLIFESDVNLLLIDEPEISLHIAWQKEMMNDLKSIVDLKKDIQVIIATHSPQIISNYWDLQIDLGGQYNG